MEMGKLRNRISNRIVNRAAEIAARHMNQGHIHMRCGNRGGQHFAAIALQQDDIRLDLIENGGDAENLAPDRASHGFSGIVFSVSQYYFMEGSELVVANL